MPVILRLAGSPCPRFQVGMNLKKAQREREPRPSLAPHVLPVGEDRSPAKCGTSRTEWGVWGTQQVPLASSALLTRGAAPGEARMTGTRGLTCRVSSLGGARRESTEGRDSESETSGGELSVGEMAWTWAVRKQGFRGSVRRAWESR